MEIVVATLPWHVVGLQMVPSGYAKNGAGDKVGLQQLSVGSACTAEPESSNTHWHTVPSIHAQSPVTCLGLYLSTQRYASPGQWQAQSQATIMPTCLWTVKVMKNSLRRVDDPTHQNTEP